MLLTGASISTGLAILADASAAADPAPTNMVDVIFVLAVLAGAAILFATEKLAVDLVALLALLALVLKGILPIDQALAGFGHQAVIGVGALFIVSEGLLRTGALGVVANRLESWSAGHESRLLLLVLLIVATASGFLNNTPVVAMFIPIVLGISLKMGFNPSHMLMPLSYAAILGGTCTLIGTSTNIIVASIVEEHGKYDPPGMFEFTKLGVIFTGVGLIYLYFFGRRLLPDRQTITSMTAGSGDRRLREYVTEIGIKAGGPLVGKKFGETIFASTKGVRVIQLIRGEEIIWPPLADEVLHDGDALVASGKIQDLMELQSEDGVETLEEILSSDVVEVASHETELAEILIIPNSPFVGKKLEDAHFRNHFGLNVIAIQRHGMHLRKKISEHPIRVGDLLLVQGTPDSLARVQGEEGLVLMSGVEDVIVRKDKAGVAMGIFVAVILLLSLSGLGMATVALIGALAMVLSGCLPAGKVYDAIHWRVLILIGGTLALGRAMDVTGTAELIATFLVDLFRFGGPHAVVVVMLILAALLTECVSNNAVAAVMVPIALKMPDEFPIEAGSPMSPYPFIFAVAYGASCSFLTPIGYQTNTLVYGAGGYKFTDFMRLGLPLVAMLWIIGGFAIPWFWPFYPPQ